MIRRAVLVVVIALVLAATSSAQRVVYQQVTTVDNAATYPPCTNGSTPANCAADVSTTAAYCTIETAPLRWLIGTPTTTVGHLAAAGTSISVAGSHANVVGFRMIATTATAAVVTCEVSRP